MKQPGSKDESDDNTMDPRITLYVGLSAVFFMFEIIATAEYLKKIPILLLWIATLFIPHHPKTRNVAMAASLLYHVYETYSRMPSVWDSDLWVLQADLAVASWLIFGSSSSSDVLWRAVRGQFTCFYFAAGFWKLNSHFLDPDASCSTMFVVQLIAQYLTPIVSPNMLVSIASVAKATAPVMSLVVELSMGGLLILGAKSRTCERMGVLLILAFHFMVCLVPQPNDISGFALNCGTSLVAFASVDGTRKAMSAIRNWQQDITILLMAVVAIGVSLPYTPNNWAFALYTVVAAFIAYAIVSEGKDSEHQAPSVKKSLLVWTAITIALLYSFGGLMTGLMEEATPNMFANLKVHGGSNHYILPTGLLFHNNLPDSHPLGGGVVRIEDTTSIWLQWIYPADHTSLLQPSNVVDLLTEIGTPPPSYFNPGASRILRYTPDPDPSKFIQYTVPALELKRLLREAKEYDSKFDLTFAQLPGTRGDEVWRATATRRRFHVKVRHGVVEKCLVTDYESSVSPKQCAPNDLPMLDDDAVPAILKKFSMHHAYPIVPNAETGEFPRSITCFGP